MDVKKVFGNPANRLDANTQPSGESQGTEQKPALGATTLGELIGIPSRQGRSAGSAEAAPRQAGIANLSAISRSSAIDLNGVGAVGQDGAVQQPGQRHAKAVKEATQRRQFSQKVSNVFKVRRAGQSASDTPLASASLAATADQNPAAAFEQQAREYAAKHKLSWTALQIQDFADGLQTAQSRGLKSDKAIRTLAGVVSTSTPLSPSQIESANKAMTFVDNLDLKPLADKNDPHTHYLPFVFDGTNNDVAKMVYPTNPGLFEKDLFPSTNGTDSIVYKPGVGTGKEGILGSAAGLGAKRREKAALVRLGQEMQKIYADDPNANVVIVGVGFSRGATELRDFSHLVSRGVPVPGARKSKSGDAKVFEGDKAPRFGAMVLYDTVGSIGFPGTKLNPGYDLSISTHVENVLHVTAADEKRVLFPLTSATNSKDAFSPSVSADGRIAQVGIPGAHSDVGGSYGGAYAYFGLDMAHHYLEKLGVPLNPLTDPNGAYDYDVTHYSPDKMEVHDSRWGLDRALETVKLAKDHRKVFRAHNSPASGTGGIAPQTA
jgi:hypothetical protein